MDPAEPPTLIPNGRETRFLCCNFNMAEYTDIIFSSYRKVLCFFSLFLKKICTHLDVLGLSCITEDMSLGYTDSPVGTWDPEYAGSVVVVPGLAALWHVGSWFPSQGLTHVPCIARQILNHWTTREV